MKPHIKTLPCFPQVASVIGESSAQIELFKAIHSDCEFDKSKSKITSAFSWIKTPQGYNFWRRISQGVNPGNNFYG